MAKARFDCARAGVLAALLAVLAPGTGVAAAPDPETRAIVGGPTPAAIKVRQGQTLRSCPLIVSAANSAVQPLALPPAEVAAKNKAGCLSSADAIYGPDGCPLKLCGEASGSIPLPGYSLKAGATAP